MLKQNDLNIFLPENQKNIHTVWKKIKSFRAHIALLKSLINKENISQIHFPYLKETSSNTTPSASILKRFKTYLASLYDQYITRF
ncbi:hypothetical protein A3Q56_05247 [Intoshia linei]|uniref:Uncharacterized protein n=1 Tax=Intoshia linei TaxID=1819745 RepID=A0A177AYD1_9BILA|nr:hypothetical protein A3Q56_05247 [Intoshia linei]